MHRQTNCAWSLALALWALPSSIEAADIFPPQSQHVHSSSLVELPGGGLLACWYQGSGERRANDVRVRGARLAAGEERWSAPFELVDTPGLPDCNPVLFVDRKERLWLFWIVVQANRWEHSVLKYRRADAVYKSGPIRWSWQDTIHLVPGERFTTSLEDGFRELASDEGLWAEYAPPYSRSIVDASRDARKRQSGWMPRTHPITLASGRIVLPLYSDGFNVSLMALSDDDGDTWRASAPIVGLGPIQPSVCRRPDGSLLALCRDSGNRPARVLESLSKDDGETWSVARDRELPNPGSSLEAIVLEDGRWLLVHNDTESGRWRLSAEISEDAGATWKRHEVLEESPDKAASFSYPALIQTRDGTVQITYSVRSPEGGSIRHRRLELDDRR